jgi:NAD(P)-dependent dehydrogenase (short-subunit alcohol dehydrogenase family)
LSTRGNDSGPARLLQGRTALVTGGGRRVGKVLVRALAGAGARVIIHYRNSDEQARALAEQIRSLGAGATIVRADLADPAAAAGLIAQAAREFGSPDILVNNASLFEDHPLADISLADWERHQAVNLRAPFLLSQAFARALPAEQPGDIINLNDWRALRPGADHVAYTISKVGLHGLTRSLALALAPRIRVNELALGAVLPPEKASDEYMHALKQDIPNRRFSTPDDVAHGMLFLLANPAVTGQTIHVDGGRNLV